VSTGAKRPKAHHVLPQFYLIAWADEKGLIAMLNRDGKEVKTGARSLAVETDFYAFERDDGEKDSSVELALAEVDGKGSEVHRTLLEGRFPPSQEEKATFASWIGLQWVRGRWSRSSGEELADKLQKMLFRFALENAELGETRGDGESEDREPEPLPEELRDEPSARIPDLSWMSKSQREELSEQLDKHSFIMPRPFQLRQMLISMPQAAQPFLDSEWHLLRFESPELLTSDEPIILQRRPRPENRFLGIGPASADHLYFPLSPSTCLAMIRNGRAKEETICELPSSEAKLINRDSLATFWSQLFRHPQSPEFPGQIPKLPEERIEIQNGPE
jgi:hypothetical protein